MPKKESDLAKPIAEWMRGQGYTVYAEIPWMFRCIDFVCIKDSQVVCIELKTNLCRKVIYQASLCQITTEKVYVGIGTKPKKSSVESCKKIGLGILSVQNGRAMCLLEPCKRYEPSVMRQEMMIRKCQHLTPSDDAGKPCQAGCGPAQMVGSLVKEYVKENPEAGWREIFNNVPNHYSNYQSMAGAMSGYLGLTLTKLKSKAD